MPQPRTLLEGPTVPRSRRGLPLFVRTWRNGCPDVLRMVFAPGGLSGVSSSTATNAASREAW
jgi:hypothetical protein